MAMAVQSLSPEAQVTIGPWIDNGFYYDFFMTNNTALASEDFKKIKKAMDKIISKDLPIRREEVSREEAERRIKSINEPFKLEVSVSSSYSRGSHSFKPASIKIPNPQTNLNL